MLKERRVLESKIGKKFTCYCDESDVYFTKDEAMEIAECINKNGCRMIFNEENNCFEYTESGSENGKKTLYKAQTFSEIDEPLYAIGWDWNSWKLDMKVILIEPTKRARVVSIADSLESIQDIVGGLFQVIYPYRDSIALICNDEGRLLGLPFNRALCDENGRMYDIVCGTFMLAGIANPAGEDDGDFYDLSDGLIKKYMNLLGRPEMLVHNVETDKFSVVRF